jgi:LacI family transcriptional regulator
MPESRERTNSGNGKRPKTIIDIAREAGVSKSTVSRVINGNLNVSPDARTQVLAAMAKMDYQLNAAARSLRTKRSHLAGLIMPGIKHVFYSTTAEVLERELRKEGISLLIASSGGLVEGEIRAINSLRSHGAESLILSLVDENDPRIIATLQAVRQRMLLLDREVPAVTADSVLIDPQFGVDEAVEHLTSLGHSQIALITHGMTVRPGREVKMCFEKAMVRFGLDPTNQVLLGFDDVGSQIGWSAAEKIISSGVTAILSLGPSSITAGVLNFLSWKGLRIPDDISVVVYDETELSSAMRPGLTAIVRPLEEYACLASQLLVSRLADPEAKPRLLTVPTRLVVRESTGKLRALSNSN